ncbi:hypothetical protein LCGC14_2058940, partial [marine sediment metagenome]
MSIVKVCPVNPEHGEVDLEAGCPVCVAERRTASLAVQVKNKLNQEVHVKAMENIAESLGIFMGDVTPDLYLVKVRYYSQTTGEASEREYTYYSEEPLSVGDILMVPTRNTKVKAIVSAINVPMEEIEAFKDSMKSIPAGSKLVDQSPDFRAPEPLSEDAREKITAGRDEMIEAATAEDSGLMVVATDMFRPDDDTIVATLVGEAKRFLEYAEGRVVNSPT